MNKKHIIVTALALVAGISVAGSVSAETAVNVKADIKAAVDTRFDGNRMGPRNEAGSSTRPDFERSTSTKDYSSRGRLQVVVGTVTSIDGNVIVITDSQNVAHTVSATSTKIFAATGTTTIEVSSLKVGDSVRVVDADADVKIDGQFGKKGIFGRIWGACRSFFARLDR